MNTEGPVVEQRPTIWVAIYARKSGDENLNGVVTSIESQVAACRSYIEIQKEKGWQPWPEVFEDPAESGKSLNRPGMQRLLATVQQGRAQVIITYKLDRLIRSSRDFQRLVDVFEKHNVGLKLIGEHARHERHEYSVNKFGFTLKGLVRCGKCGSALVGYVRPKKNKVYRYYRCMAMVEERSSPATS